MPDDLAVTVPPSERPDRDATANISFRHVFVATVVGTLIFAALSFVVWLLTGRPDPDDWFEMVGRNAVLALGALGAAPAGYIAYRRQRTLEQQRHDDRDKRDDDLDGLDLERRKEETRRVEVDNANARADPREFRARYSEAAAQLGHDRAAVRLAGVYAMAQLADDWARTSQHSARPASTFCAPTYVWHG